MRGPGATVNLAESLAVCPSRPRARIRSSADPAVVGVHSTKPVPLRMRYRRVNVPSRVETSASSLSAFAT